MAFCLTGTDRMPLVSPSSKVTRATRRARSLIMFALELVAFPDALEVSVVARKHPTWGERPMAFVTLKAHAVKKWKGKAAEFETELKKFARSRLPGFACPEWVAVVEELPVCPALVPLNMSNVYQKTSTGKTMKTALRTIAAKL